MNISTEVQAQVVASKEFASVMAMIRMRNFRQVMASLNSLMIEIIRNNDGTKEAGFTREEVLALLGTGPYAGGFAFRPLSDAVAKSRRSLLTLLPVLDLMFKWELCCDNITTLALDKVAAWIIVERCNWLCAHPEPWIETGCSWALLAFLSSHIDLESMRTAFPQEARAGFDKMHAKMAAMAAEPAETLIARFREAKDAQQSVAIYATVRAAVCERVTDAQKAALVAALDGLEMPAVFARTEVAHAWPLGDFDEVLAGVRAWADRAVAERKARPADWQGAVDGVLSAIAMLLGK